MGKIKRAWFTTFNLDISFFEKYMLSALIGTSYQDLRSPYDYEALSANLANEQDFQDNEQIEVKVFYDYRALIASGKTKQTTVHLHPIDIRQVSGLNSNVKFTYGVFHPKVILIETYKSEYWLMVSSSNLTFGGWSRNREGFFCEKIEDTDAAREIGIFFSGITTSIRGFEDNPLIEKLNRGKFGNNNSKWYFFSSFDKNKFIDQLNYIDKKLPLRVWSPYFAEDLPGLVDEIQEEHFETIEIVPSKNEGQKIRITEESYNKCLIKEGVSFKQDKLPYVAREAFVHAKIWLTPKALAIGSWNMTRSGINESKDGNNNIEAGIIYELTPKEYQVVLDNSTITALKSHEHFKKEELDSEKEEILDKFKLVVDIVVDWEKLQVQLQNPTYNKLIRQIDEDDFIKLPGIGKRKIRDLQEFIDIRSYTRIFLTDRFFEIEIKNGETVYKGYLREIGLTSRPVNSFENLDDYLKGWVMERPEDKKELHKLAYPVEEDTGDGISTQTRNILYSNDQNAWFTSFHAFECIINRINHSSDCYAKEKIAILKRIGRVLPGSLSELKIHLETLLERFRNDRSKFLKSPIYLWFIIEKANYVFSYFNNEIGIKSEFIKPIKNLDFNEFLNKEQIKDISEDSLEKWIYFIINKLKN